MSLTTLPATDALQRLATFDTIIDARTEDEYALDHIPGALNWPTLNNEERITIGTMYKQVNAFEAKKRGAALSARNIAAHIERAVLDQPKTWKPLVYCWRGGNRSGALATILSAIGFQVTLVEGGYKAWRASLVADLDTLPPRFLFRVLCGPTGSGKTRLLQALQTAGAQVLDLEGFACHRSSVLGMIPGQPQPSQKKFESTLWAALQGFDPTQPVFVESESKKVGNLRVPDALMEAMRQSPCLNVVLPMQERVALLLEDYAHFVTEPETFCQRLQALIPHRGHETVNTWLECVRTGQISTVVEQLLTLHYDPTYQQSTPRNYQQFGYATQCELQGRTQANMDAMARQILNTAS